MAAKRNASLGHRLSTGGAIAESARCAILINVEEARMLTSVEAFLTSIDSRDLKMVGSHWCVARGTRMMPSWSQLKPAALSKQLPIIWAYRYDPQTGEFMGRLAGDRISQIFEKQVKGTPMENLFPPKAFKWAYRLFSRVVREPAIYWSSGQIFSHLDRHGSGERIILPLSSDGITADGILGATEYRYPHPNRGPSPADEETENWLSLRPQRSGERRD